MNRIVLIGAGQLGSRYLQGLKSLSVPASIAVVEPDPTAQKTARERYDEIPQNAMIQNLSFHRNLSEIPSQVDLAIVTTTSTHRFQIVKELMSSRYVKYLILEKVLFQSITEYEEMDKLLNTENIHCWVNHPKRIYPLYQRLRSELGAQPKLSFVVQGGNWGLACNGLHFLDLLSFLSNDDAVEICTEYLDNKIYDSKRTGFIEMQGALTGHIGGNNFFISSGESSGPVTISISSDNCRYIINEPKNLILSSTKDQNWDWSDDTREKIIYFQSEITHSVTETVLTTGKCNLPTYMEAMKLHVPFLTALLNKYNQINNSHSDSLPIT